MRMLVMMTGLCLASAAAAKEAGHEQDCSASTPTLPPELSGWARSAPLTAASSSATANRTPLTIGQSARLSLLPTPDVRYALRPEKPGGFVSHGGIVSFTVERAGLYRVALGSGAWIDVVQGGKAVSSAAHGHGPSCSGIRKMVDFQLSPGRYLLQIAGNGEPVIPVMVAALP